MGKKKKSSQKYILPILIFSLLINAVLIINKFFPNLDASSSEKNQLIIVSRVVDGDTVVTERGEYIRLAGIDAPEYPKGCLSTKAKERLEKLVLGKKLKLEEIDKDRFSRILGFLFLDEILINKILVEEGLAKVEDDKLDYSPALIKAEIQAKAIKKGIWSSLCSKKGNCLIKGNVRRDRDTKIYHTPDCYNYEKIVVSEDDGDRWFCSEKQAQKAGFTKSKDCPGK